MSIPLFIMFGKILDFKVFVAKGCLEQARAPKGVSPGVKMGVGGQKVLGTETVCLTVETAASSH